MSKAKKIKPTKRDLIELGVILSIFAVIYFTGTQAEVFGKVQQAVLYTGVMNAGELDDQAKRPADYQFKLMNEDGDLIDVQTLKGKAIFMNIWATWCAPCIAEMPGINNLYDKIGQDEEVVFLMISEDKDFNKAKEWVKEKGFNFPIYRLATSLPEVYETYVVPSTFVISKQGEIIVKKTGMANYDTRRFRKLLTEE